MQKTAPTPSKGGLGLQDILFVLFKHKWKILGLGVLGVSAAAMVYVTQKPLFESHSRILVKHVIQRGGADSVDSQVEAGGRSGEQVINTEMVILRSGDLATEVAQSVGIERLVPGATGPSALTYAGWVVQGGLEVVPEGRGSNVLIVTYRHGDPELARDVLTEIIKRYPDRHLEIHRSVGAFDSVSKQANIVKEKLHTTEKELNKLKADSGIISVHEQSLSLSSQRDKTQGDIVAAEAELAAQGAKVEALESRLTGEADLAQGADHQGSKSTVAAPKPEQVEEYRELVRRLEYLQGQDLALRSKFAAGNPLVLRNQQDINATKAARNALLTKAPGLAMEAAAPSGEAAANPAAELDHEKAVMGSINARIGRYKIHLAELEAKFKKLTEIGPHIAELERQREMQDGEYRLLESNLKKAEVDRNLDRSEIPGLKVVEQPTLPQLSVSEITKKIMLGLCGGGFALGLGLAFLVELVVDRRITRPTEIETRLQVPLMLSIPYVRPRHRGAHLIANDSSDEAAGDDLDKPMLPAVRAANGFPAFAGRTDHFIHPYSEAIRDRIVFNFQINNMTHKPKLMAVTGLSAGAGTSTIAAGLAKAFSEVNGAKVLLVDLNSDYPDDNPMFGNKPLHSVVGALQAARNTRFKEGGQNLYLASAAATKSDPSATPFGPMHLYELLPHFRASEFDYVIFDMPPMGQTSPTLAMAGLMDKVLLVVDGEDTSRDALKWGYSELVKGRADVSCVFNKARSHAPRWVAGDI
jgi:succinoglycan biosynthesis transport protein ExoP